MKHFLIIIFILAVILQLYHLSFFEFKDDQLDAIRSGHATRQMHFLITHGLCSGVGVSNPPLFLWFMGVLTFFTQNPLYLTAVFAVLNLLALFLAMRYFYGSLPGVYAVLASLLLAFSPAFTIYSSNIWAQCLLPPIIMLFFISFSQLIKSKQPKYFIFLSILASLASQLHLSGFFLFPLLAITAIYLRRDIGWKAIIQAILLIIILFSPYLYHLFFQKGLKSFLAYADFTQRSVYWKIFREHLRMSSVDFFRHYFRYDFNAILGKSVGILKFILYPLSCLLMGFFAVSLMLYLRWLIKGRRIFNSLDTKYPLPFQISGLMILSITLGYLVFRIHSPLHYLIVLYPAYGIFTAFIAWRLWRFFWARVIIAASLVSTVILLVAVLMFIRGSGGHPNEYGPHYALLLDWKNEIRAKIPEGACPQLTVAFIGKGKSDIAAASWVILGDNKCASDSKLLPIKLMVNWNPDLMRYEHSLIY